MKIKISKERITHYQALCHNCGWVEADHVDREWLRQEVHKHIRKTGHSVSIEKGTSTLYEAAEQKRPPDAGWSCYHCGYPNSSGAALCINCRKPRR